MIAVETSAEAPWLTVIGVGDEGVGALQGEARAALDAADIVIGSKRLLEGQDFGTAQVELWGKPLCTVIGRLKALSGRRVVVLATGDPMHFGVGATLARHLAPGAMRVMAAPSAFSLAAARLFWPLQNVTCLSAHGAKDGPRGTGIVTPHLSPGARLLLLTRDGEGPAEVARHLAALGYGASRLTVLEHLGGAKERIRVARADAFNLDDVADLNTLAIDCVADAATEPLSRLAGLPDDVFSHDGKMTKSEMRAVTLAALAPRDGQHLWDIGAGCGSVTVEWLRAGRNMRATAFENTPTRAAMMRENLHRLAPPGALLHEGEAQDHMAQAAVPDAIFIGGGVSDAALVDAARGFLPPDGILVANAVTPECEAVLITQCRAHGGSLTRLAVDRLTGVGDFHALRPGMPVLQWRYRKAAQG